jgi:hypothetical protein
MYSASVPVLVRGLKNLSALLDKAAQHAQDRQIDAAVFIEGRLAADMFPLRRQVQSVSDVAKGCAARLAGIEIPSFADTETSFAELQERIARTIAFLESVSAAQIDGSEERAVTIKARGREIPFTGQSYLLAFAMPNFYFHLTTAYDILRHLGVDIGKMDYLGAV